MDKCQLAVDIGGSKLMVGIVDSRGQILDKARVPLKPDIREQELADNIVSLAGELIKKHPRLDIDCAGVTIPGLADPEKGLWVYACFSGIRDFKIVEVLSQRLGMRVFIENDANACAFGEMVYGVGKGVRDFLWITVSNGVGGGLVLNGDIYRGAFKSAAEVGHINVAEDGRLCPCGNRGCLEAHAAGPAIAKSYLEKRPDLKEAAITAKEVAQLARSGDKAALEVYRETGYYLGKAISYAVNLINPVKVVLGGGVSMDIDLFLPELKKTVDRLIFRDANRNLTIERTGLLYDAALIGAAAIARRGMGRFKQ